VIHLILILTGGVVAVVWGAAHIMPARAVVSGFGQLSPDNRNIILMEWVAEGLTLVFLGVLVLSLAATAWRFSPAAVLTYRLAAGMLVAMAVWSLFTGARTAILPMKLCPLIKSLCALAIVLGSLAG
jgi:hypothetical protein